jgi:alkylated DNA repair protein alkB homolog 7
MQGHHDRVIRRYREMHLSAWPTDEEFPGLGAVVKRIHSMCPTKETQTHLLHLASDGDILPHVDNVGASGSWILGVSLGGERTLRLQHPDPNEEPVEFVLTPGCLYVQR